MSDQLDRFIEQLCELELDPVLLRDDPGGERWLPASLLAMVVMAALMVVPLGGHRVDA